MIRTSAAELLGAAEIELPEDLPDLSATPWRRIWLSATRPVWTLVDAEDHVWLSAFTWNEWHAGGGDWMRYAKRNVGPGRATLRMHREIMIAREPGLSEAFLRGHMVDHVNGQTLDNRRANLRWATGKQNHRNRRPRGSAPALDQIVRELLDGLGARRPLEEVPF